MATRIGLAEQDGEAKVMMKAGFSVAHLRLASELGSMVVWGGGTTPPGRATGTLVARPGSGLCHVACVAGRRPHRGSEGSHVVWLRALSASGPYRLASRWFCAGAADIR